MGKRKKSSRTPQGPKKRDPLPVIFTCLFCNHERSVSVKLDKKAGVGQLDCKTCGQKFQCAINYLSAPVDVYSEWVDAADAVANGETGGGDSETRASIQTKSASGTASQRRRADEDDDMRYEGEGIVADNEYD